MPWEKLFAAPVAFSEANDKPLIGTEFGVGEDAADPERKARWYRDAVRAIEQMPRIKAVVSFNSEAACSAYAASSAPSLAGYRDLVQAPSLQPQVAGR